MLLLSVHEDVQNLEGLLSGLIPNSPISRKLEIHMDGFRVNQDCRSNGRGLSRSAAINSLTVFTSLPS